MESFFPELFGIKPLIEIDDEFYYKSSSIKEIAYISSTTLDYVVIFERTEMPGSYLEKIHPSRIVGELFPVTLSVYEPVKTASKFSFLMDFLDNVQCYKAYFGTDMDIFADKIDELTKL